MNQTMLRQVATLAALLGGLLLATRDASAEFCNLENGTWHLQSGDSERGTVAVQLDVSPQAGFCGDDFNVTVWSLPTGPSGPLFNYLHGPWPAHYQTFSDGSRWLVVNQFGDGGYIEHLYLHEYVFSGTVYLRAWVYQQSVDSKPDSSSDHWFVVGPLR